MARYVEPERWNKYLEIRKAGGSMAFAAREARISYSTVRAFEAGAPNSSGMAWKKVREAKEIPAPITKENLCTEALRALEDFGYFRYRYFGRKSTPWQEEAAEGVVTLLATPHKEFLVVNAPPGSGKSTLFTHDIPAWLTCRDRSITGMLGSASQFLAERYTLALRTTLENPYPIKAEADQLELGLAVDAQATLVADYGGFRPAGQGMWSVKAFTVEQIGGIPTTGKEPTWSAFGPDSAFIGLRPRFAAWDDLVDRKSVQSLEAIEKLRGDWDSVAEKRIEPAGLLVLQGQRLSPEDLYRHNLDKTAGSDSERSHDECCDAEPGRKYHHIRFRAHYDERCEGAHGIDAPYYPDGCLLDPRRLPWSELDTEMSNGLSNYLQVYQQEDADPAQLLVHPLWISGGTDPVTKEVFPGCWDENRSLRELPSGLPRNGLISMASTDPSPTRMWASEWWVYSPDGELRFLMDIERKAMGANEFIDWDWSSGSFVGLMEDWWWASKRMGLPITHWIVEANAAQRFMLQTSAFRRWASTRGVQIIAHETNRNKLDRKLGPDMLAGLYKFGKIRLPGAQGPSRPVALRLVDEVQKYPKGRYDDCVMSQWFFEYNLPRLSRPSLQRSERHRPSWIEGSRRRRSA